MKPLLFIPGAQTANDVKAAIAKHGLNEIFPRINLNSAPCVGPEGIEGTINGYERTIYRADDQAWTSCAGGAYWVGVWDSNRPTPADLEKEVCIPGHSVRLSDGNDWIVPVARRFPSGGTLLERRVVLDEDGEASFEILGTHLHLYEVASTVYESLASDNNFSLGDTEAIEVAVEALAVNYRLNGILAANVLKLFTTSNLSEILYALVDWPTLMKMIEASNSEKLPTRDAKKNGAASDSRSGATGEAGTPPATSQPSPTSN